MTTGSLQVCSIDELDGHSSLPEIWREVVSDIGDVYYECSYLQTAALYEDGQIMLAAFTHPSGSVMYPFVRRSLDGLPFASSVPRARYDIVTPYEYGGPLVRAVDDECRQTLHTDFIVAFGDYCRSDSQISSIVF